MGAKILLKRLSAFFLFALVMGIMLMGCGGGSEEADSQSESNVEESDSKGATISFIHWRGEDTDAFNAIIEDFEEENPDIKVNMDAFPSDQYETTLQTKLKNGASGDVFAMFPGVQFETITNADLAEDISNEDFVSRFLPHFITVGERDGTQFGLPLQLVFNIPIYNKTMF